MYIIKVGMIKSQNFYTFTGENSFIPIFVISLNQLAKFIYHMRNDPPLNLHL